MFKNLRQFYAIAICFFAALILMIGSVWMIVDVINLGFPEQRCDTLIDYTSNDRYREKKRKEMADSPWEGPKKPLYNPEMDTWNEEKITAKRLQEREYVLQEYHDKNLRGLTNSLIWMMISGLFFGIHWRLYRKL